MIEITPTLSIEESEIDFDLIRSSGPGGQNVNKVATAVQLRFDIQSSLSLPNDVKQRLIKIAGNRVTYDGILILIARRFRSQEKNRIDAVQRLITLIRKAMIKPKFRKPTQPSNAAIAERIYSKKKRSEIKRNRRSIRDDFEK